ncbi:MAG: hypothetical protein ACJ786_00585 [Catenulispora sp.]
MKIPGGVAAIAVSAVLTTALAACGGGSDAKVSIDNMQKTADKMIAAGDTNSCPLGFDVNAALKKAGITATAKPSDGAHSPLAAYAESATNATRLSPLYQRGGAVINCAYTLSSGGSLKATLFGVRVFKAMPIVAPQLSHDAQAEVSELDSFISKKLDTGKAMVTPGDGRAAIEALDTAGGDAVLEVTTDDPDSSLKAGPVLGEPLRKLTEALGKQVRV